MCQTEVTRLFKKSGYRLRLPNKALTDQSGHQAVEEALVDYQRHQLNYHDTRPCL